MTMEIRAKEYATHCHEGQLRNYTSEPYIVHPAEVAKIVRSVPHDEAMLCAAWLHDTVEMSRTNIVDDIHRVFGQAVAELVLEVTNISKRSDGPRAIRVAMDRGHLAKASPRGKTIKLADVISNTRTISHLSPRFARTYLVEKYQLLQVLTKGDATLWALAHDIITGGARSLGINLLDQSQKHRR